MKNQIKIILNIILYIIFIQLSTVLPKNDRNLNASIKTAEMLAKRGDSDNAISIYLGLNKKSAGPPKLNQLYFESFSFL